MCIWIPSPLEDFSCKSFFCILLDYSPSKEFVFDVLWRIKIPKKSFTRSCEHYGLALEKDTLVSWAFRCRKGEGVLDHLFWSCEFTRFVWLHFFQEVGILFALHRYIRDMIGEFLLHPTFGEKDRFSMVCWSLCDVMGLALLS